jgi:flagellar biogenesis protein FliO
VFFVALIAWLGLFSFPILILKRFVSKTRDTKCVVVLVGS